MDRVKYMGTNKFNRKEQRARLIDNPKLILAYFKKQLTTDNKFPQCHVWGERDATGKIATLNGYPRFGTAKLAPPPANNINARHYIYNTTYPHSPLPKHTHLKMLPTCHKLCVNPAHMYPRPKKAAVK